MGQRAPLGAITPSVRRSMPSAHAQQAEIDINTPQINAIKARMAQRQRSSLNSLFDAGAVGFSNDGLLMIR